MDEIDFKSLEDVDFESLEEELAKIDPAINFRKRACS